MNVALIIFAIILVLCVIMSLFRRHPLRVLSATMTALVAMSALLLTVGETRAAWVFFLFALVEGLAIFFAFTAFQNAADSALEAQRHSRPALVIAAFLLLPFAALMAAAIVGAPEVEVTEAKPQMAFELEFELALLLGLVTLVAAMRCVRRRE